MANTAEQVVKEKIVDDSLKVVQCLCGCGSRVLLREYQSEWSQEQYNRATKQYLHPSGICDHNCAEKCLHGFSVFLGWEQRVGKTPAFLYYLHMTRNFLKAQGDIRWTKPILILALAKNEQDIIDQCKLFMPGQDTTKVVKLDGDAKDLAEFREMVEQVKSLSPTLTAEYVFVGHYDSLGHGHGSDAFVREMNNWSFLAMVCDQAERAQNEGAIRSKAVESIDRDFAIMVTGEPLNNPKVPTYLWYLLQHQHAGNYEQKEWQIPSKTCKTDKEAQATALQYGCQSCSLFNRGSGRCFYNWSEKGLPTFRKREPSPSWPTQGEFIKSWMSPAHQHKIHKMLVDIAHLSRLTRSDMGWPDIEIEIVEVEPTEAQKQNYNEFLQGIRTVVKAEVEDKILKGVDISKEKTKMSTLILTAWLTQSIQSAPRTMIERSSGLHNFKAKVRENAGELHLDQFDTGNAKADKIIEIFKSIKQSDKMIIFSHYLGLHVDLMSRLDKMGLRYAYIDGQSSPTKTTEAYTEFNTSKTCRMMLATDAAAAGIPMQGGLGEGDTMFVLIPGFPFWSPGLPRECMSRPYSMAMVSKVKHISIIGMVNGQSIDLESADRLAEKESISSRVQDGDKVRSNIFSVETTSDFLDFLDRLEGKRN